MKRSYRKRKVESDDEEDGPQVDRATLQEVLEAQKFRQRARGVDVAKLAVGEKTEKEEKEEEAKKEEDPHLLVSSTQGGLTLATFKQERKQQAVELQMQKYIDEELARRKGMEVEGQVDEDEEYFNSEEYKKMLKQKEEEDMMSSAMLSGIPEVDLGMEAKIKNIEETERARVHLMREREMKKRHTVQLSRKEDNFRFISAQFGGDNRGGRGGGRGGRGGQRGGGTVESRGGGHPGPGAGRGRGSGATDDAAMDMFRKKQKRRFN